MQLIGVIERIIYTNAENGYTVCEIEAAPENVIIVGTMPLIAVGEYVEVEGVYITHSIYGKQFEVQTFSSHLPVNETAIMKYLSSGIVKGIRAKTAKQIVAAFGPDTFNIIEDFPEKLAGIKGITLEKAIKISKSLKENIGVKTVLLYFQQFGITPSLAFKIYKQWGLSAYDVLKINPYKMCEIDGIGFEKADRLAIQMDYDAKSPFRIESGLQYILNHNLYSNGHTFLPKKVLVAKTTEILNLSEDDIIEHVNGLIERHSLSYVERIGNVDGVYLNWVYENERNIANRVILASKFVNEYHGDFQRDIADIEEVLGITFAQNQRRAILESFRNQLMILTGGPGTGKTTTLNGIIKLFDKNKISYTIAAPTGRAAKRVTELTGKEAKTIHRLLEYGFKGDEQTFARNKDNPLKYDAIIIDESSMVDLWLFHHLLEAISLTTKIIMVGDANQLPPVGPGNIFKDIIASDCVCCIELKEIFRQAEQSLIVTNAHSIINGKLPELGIVNKDFFFMQSSSSDNVSNTVVDLYSKRLVSAYGYNPLTDIQVLTPSRKTQTGSFALNQALKEALNTANNGKSLKVRDNIFNIGDKVMQIRNNYDLVYEKENGESDMGVFNGDIGIVEFIDSDMETLTVKYDDKLVTYSQENLDELELAYAITVHKSQGSEFNAVILPLYEGHELLYTRNLLYTAVTRAKKLLIIVGSRQRIQMMVDNISTTKRYTALKHTLLSMMK